MINAGSDANGPSRSLWRAILGDVQFWVPFTVLLIGLLLLRIVE